jgi:hypothetical protein
MAINNVKNMKYYYELRKNFIQIFDALDVKDPDITLVKVSKSIFEWSNDNNQRFYKPGDLVGISTKPVDENVLRKKLIQFIFIDNGYDFSNEYSTVYKNIL